MSFAILVLLSLFVASNALSQSHLRLENDIGASRATPQEVAAIEEVTEVAHVPNNNRENDVRRNLQSMTLQSDAFSYGGSIPVIHTCDGFNISPALSWSDVPDGTASLAITIEDLTTPWNHWVIFNVPPNIGWIPEAAPKQSTLPRGGQQGTNSFASIGMPYMGMGYGGMCPNPGDVSEHTYLFKLYALDVMLEGLSSSTTKEELETIMMDGHVLEDTELMATYQRAADDGTSGGGSSSVSIEVQSPAFAAGGPIPVRYTCDGDDVSPPLSWNGVTDDAVTLALTIEDVTTPWNHWVIFNIPPTSDALPEAVPKDEYLSDGSVQGENSFATIGMNGVGYGGMCPQPGDYDQHSYVLRFYALDASFDTLCGDSDKDEFEAAIEGHVLQNTELTFTYQREEDEGQATDPIPSPEVSSSPVPAPVTPPGPPPMSGSMRLQSSAFSENGAIPVVHTCDGDNISPPLNFQGVPDGTATLALTVEDITTPWNHWVLFNVPATYPGLPENIPRQDSFFDGSQQGSNSFATIPMDEIATGWGGPCPGQGDFSEHTYIFRLYALDSTLLGLTGDTTKEELEGAVAENALEITELMATYQRSEDNTPTSPTPQTPELPEATGTMMLQASAFAEGGAIPVEHTCDGDNISPALTFVSVPDSAATLALTVEDITTPWNHWVLFNAPADTAGLPANVPRQATFFDGSQQGSNSFATIGMDEIATGWGGPCPGEGDFSEHTYIFRLYALDSTLLGLTSATTKEDLEAAIGNNAIATSELRATYQRSGGNIPATPDSDPPPAPAPAPTPVPAPTSEDPPPAPAPAPAPVPAPTIEDLDDFPNEMMLGDALTFRYRLDSVDTIIDEAVARQASLFNAIRIQMVYDRLGWIGFGIAGPTGQMVGSDAVIGLPDDPPSTTNPGKYDMDSQSVSGVTLMGPSQQTLIDASIVQNVDDNETTLTFTKLLDEMGELTINGTLENAQNTFLWAVGSGNELEYHSGRGVFDVDLAQGLVPPPSSPDEPSSSGAFELEASAFSEGGSIPIEHTCDGSNISPALSWENVPDGAVTLALTVEDTTQPWNHWVLFNVPSNYWQIPANVPRQARFFDGSRQGTNSFGSVGMDEIATGWGGPCPGEGDFDQHTYIFRLYAVDSSLLGLSRETTKEELEAALDGNTLASTELMATYQRAQS